MPDGPADSSRAQAAASPTVLVAKGIAKAFGTIKAVDGLDLRIEPGEVRGLLGPNGAGKTTLLRILLGLIRPDAGSIALFGRRWQPGSDLLPSGSAGFVEAPAFYPYLSGRRNLELLAALDGGVPPHRIEEALRLVVLADASGQRVGEYSTGMRQRLGIAASLLTDPRLLLLDEPTIGLDPAGARDVRALVRRLADDGVAILFSSHNVIEVEEVCRTVTIMRSGRVVWDGTIERLRAEAPAPAHVLATPDDRRALELARERGVEAVPNPRGGLTVSVGEADLDAFVIAMAQQGIPVRRLELLTNPLETMFFDLTGAQGLAEPSAEAILERAESRP